MTKPKGYFLVGVDEVGRGPIAGPVAVGVACVKNDFDFSLCDGIRDSKKLSQEKRAFFDKKMRALKKAGKLSFAISFVGNNIIDSKGISYAIKKAINDCFCKLKLNPKKCEVFLDGGLRAPASYTKQQTIIKGDDKVKIISMASVLAKVARDKRMINLSRTYPQYNFHIHKGYGTEMHYKALKKYGLSKIHRKTFLRKFLDK